MRSPARANEQPTRAYGQYCGFARALELVGERWAMMIVRDLLVSPKRFSDLQQGLGKIPSNILTSRLKQLEAAGVAQRRALPRAEGGGVVYELTPYGYELDDAVVALGRWGAKRLGDPRPNEIVTPDSLCMALHSTFHPEAAGRTHARYELHVGPAVVHAIVHDGAVTVGKGPLPKADLVIEAGPGIRAVMAQEITPQQALRGKVVSIKGNVKHFTRFARIFRI
jgi:DNA-binding HxlR family transcriptional regulator